MNVLLTNAEVYSVVNMIRSLGRKGYKVFTASENPSAFGFYSKYTNGCGLYPPSGYEIGLDSKLIYQPKKEKKFIHAIKSLVNKWNIDLLISTLENTLIPISKNRDKIDTTIALPEHEKIMMVHDKIKFMNFCMKHKISIPRTYFPKCKNEVKKVIEKEDLPLIVKPNIGSGGDLNTYLFNNRKEILNICKKILKLNKKPIIQEYVKGKCYSSTFVLDKNSKVLTSFCCTSIYPNSKFPVSEENHKIIKISKKIFKKIGWVGIISSQFIVDENNNPRILEVNPRIVSGIVDLAIECGIDLPNVLCKNFFNKKSDSKSMKSGFIYITPRYFFSFLKEFGFMPTLNYIHKKKIIIDVSFLEDPLPILAEYYYFLQKKLK